MSLKLIFLGTPKFAVPSMKAVATHHRVELVITQPDKPRGRGLRVERGPVAKIADQLGLKIIQPEKLIDVKERLLSLNVDAAVVVAYGKLLPPWLLGIGKYGCINVHPSLLPLYRGPSPIESALLNGDKKTGVSIMKLTKGMDEGPVYMQKELVVEPDDNRATLTNKLEELSAAVLIATLAQLERGDAKLTEQAHDRATYCKKIEKSDLKIDWSKTAESIINKIRAFSPKTRGVYDN